MKQTAVEWLINEIPSIDWENSYWKNRIEQAIELEKQQIIDANWEASEDTERAEEYYFNTFKKPYYGIDDEFLQWLVKNPSCEEVRAEQSEFYSKKDFIDDKTAITYSYKIIIPKEEPKKKHIVMIVGDKVNEEPKQEQAAVEWLISQLFGAKRINIEEAIEQAKELEKEQLHKAWKAAEQNMRSQFSGSAYKNVTFDEYYEALRSKKY